MAYVLKKLVSLYFYFNDECGDPRVQDWFLLSSPFKTLIILGLYLGIVLNWGPKFMKNRQPYQFDNLIRVYNLIQVAVCAHLVYEAIVLAYGRDYSFLCEPVDYSQNPIATKMAGKVYIYFSLKLLDLFDTIFFVLRKKQNQVTFLHVYHHAGMVILMWIGCKYFPGGHGVFMGALNSLVHVVMYSYYFITSISPEYKNNVWWKKYITQMQMVQFLLIIIHWMFIVFQPNCTYPKWPVALLVPQNIFMLCMFGDFYIKAYIKKKPIKKNDVNGTKSIDKPTNNIPIDEIKNDLKLELKNGEKKILNEDQTNKPVEINGKSKKVK